MRAITGLLITRSAVIVSIGGNSHLPASPRVLLWPRPGGGGAAQAGRAPSLVGATRCDAMRSDGAMVQ